MDSIAVDAKQLGLDRIKFDIEADWTLHLLCNYSCKYCFFRASTQQPLIRRISPDQYLEFFNSTGKTWLLHLTGGEPFLDPDFVRLCQTLTSQHYISVNSNLSSKRVRVFAAEVDASRVQFIHCGVHLEERDSRKGWQNLEGNVTSLLERGMPLFASLVMTPSAFADYPRVADMFTSLGVALIPKAIRGAYNNRWYPQAYTKSERNEFRRLSEQAELAAKSSMWNIVDQCPTVNPLPDRQYLDGFPDFRGIQCSAGRKFVSIDCEGRIFRCGHRTVLGDILERRLELFPEDLACDDHYCPYFCLQYSRFNEEAAANYSRRATPIKFRQPFVTIRAIRREILNR